MTSSWAILKSKGTAGVAGLELAEMVKQALVRLRRPGLVLSSLASFNPVAGLNGLKHSQYF